MSLQKTKLIKILLINITLITVFIYFNFFKFYPIYSNELFVDWLYIHDYKYCNNLLTIPKNQCLNIITNDFVYPEIWKNIANLTDVRSDFRNIIFLILFIHIFIITFYLKDFPFFVNLLFLLSPVSILLIHRGNNDLIILFLIFIFNVLLTNQKRNLKFISLVPLIIAIKAKIYPLSLLPIYMLLKNNVKKINFFVYLLFLFFLTIILIYFSEYFKLSNIYNRSGATLSFSSALIFKIFTFITEINLNYKILSVVVLVMLIFISIYSKISVPISSFKNEISFLIGSSIIVSSFFLNEGFVYKLVFLIFIFPLIFEYKKKGYIKIYLFLLTITLTAMWIEYISFLVENILNINNSHPKLFPGFNVNNIVYGTSIIIKNIIYWILNISLIFISSRIFLKRLKI